MQAEPFKLVLDDYVPFVDPKEYGIKDLLGIKPSDYFITSGDAIAKATVLEKDLWVLAGETRKRFGNGGTAKQKAFQAAVWSAAGKCRHLLHKLKEIRGTAIFLETDRVDHELILLPKNPRSVTSD